MPLTAITTSNIDTTNSLFFRNRIINGAMRISQRGTSFTGLTAGSQYSLDRYQLSFSGSNNGTWAITQDTDAPAGFNNSLKLACTSSYTSGSDNYLGLSQIIEGYNVADLQWGTASAKPVTVSFWIKCTRAGNLLLELYKNRNASRLITINNSNTWEYKTFTFLGDTVANVMDTTNSYGIYVNIFAMLGTSYKTGTLHTEFGTYDSAARATGLQNLGASGDAVWITGLQLEVGTAATAFETRPYGVELKLCQRYYEILNDTYYPLQIPMGYTTYAAGYWRFLEPKRATPTVSDARSISGSTWTNVVDQFGQGSFTATSSQIDAASQYGCRIALIFSGGLGQSGTTHGDMINLQKSGIFQATAEL
jgi:hypothetical protein